MTSTVTLCPSTPPSALIAAAAAFAPSNSAAPATASGPLEGPIRAIRKGVPEPAELELPVPVLAALLAEGADELEELEELLPQAASTTPITTARIADARSFFAPADAA
jgi:hypothetical protein